MYIEEILCYQFINQIIKTKRNEKDYFYYVCYFTR